MALLQDRLVQPAARVRPGTALDAPNTLSLTFLKH